MTAHRPVHLTPLARHILGWSLALVVSCAFWTVLIAAYLIGQNR